MKNLLLAICALGFSGCILISGIGDSNSNSTPDLTRWVKRLPPLIANSVTFEWGRGGGSINDFTNCTGDCATTYCGRELLQCSLTANHPNRVILAFGTNDLVYLFNGGTFDDVVTAYQSRITEAAAANAVAYAALTPPVFCGAPGFDACGLPYNEARVEQLNALLVAHFGTANLVDFWTGFTSAEYVADGIHLNDAGQQHRAQVAADFINSH